MAAEGILVKEGSERNSAKQHKVPMEVNNIRLSTVVRVWLLGILATVGGNGR